MDKSTLYGWLERNGFKRESVVDSTGVVSHEWERYCPDCPRLSFIYTNPKDYGSTALDDIYDQARTIVNGCGHPL